MKLLSEILYKAGITDVVGQTHIAVSSITSDSRKVERMGLFVAVRGTTSDGHRFIDSAVASGALAIVCEQMPEIKDEKVTYIQVKDSAYALGQMASNFYDQPSSRLKLIGITGTNGKTTCVTLLYQLFRLLGYKCGLISTVKYLIDREELPSTHTTPDPVQLNFLLSEMVQRGCTYAFMEVSSHAVDQKRIAGLEFAVAGFTNITHDHLDYHGDFDHYLQAKKGFFDQLSASSIAIVNRDDRNGKIMLQNTKAKKYFYSVQQGADFKAKLIESHIGGQLISLDGKEVWTRLIGGFNVYNVLLVYATAVLLEQEKNQVLTSISTLVPVDGRFQFVKSENGVTAIVDYAHTPDALQNILESIQELRTGNENLITVVGCGGNRDPLKRPVMAGIAARFSNRLILTSDNPRNEDPKAIIHEMALGLDPVQKNKVLEIEDRRQAIKLAVSLANAGDIILVAGKGHEKYQEIQGVKYPFDDLEEIKNQFKERA